MSGVRKFPFPQGGDRGKRGFCRWCGGRIWSDGGHRRYWHQGKESEPNCLYELWLHTRLEEQYAYLVHRDGERCADCGQTPLKIVREAGGATLKDLGGYPQPWRDWWGDVGPRGAEIGQLEGHWCGIEIKPALEVDHSKPLWLVAHLPPDERRPFFGPENLKLRCVQCHSEKTAREAGERAKGNRLREPPPQPRRRIPSRPFPKGRRPLRGQS